jgi:hypothetical protein
MPDVCFRSAMFQRRAAVHVVPPSTMRHDDTATRRFRATACATTTISRNHDKRCLRRYSARRHKCQQRASGKANVVRADNASHSARKRNHARGGENTLTVCSNGLPAKITANKRVQAHSSRSGKNIVKRKQQGTR